MSDESSLVIGPSLELDTTQCSDQAIIQLNQACAKLYEERRRKIIRLFWQMPSVVEVAKNLVADKSYRVVIPPEILRRLKDGIAHWGHRADGLLGAIIKDSKTVRQDRSSVRWALKRSHRKSFQRSANWPSSVR